MKKGANVWCFIVILTVVGLMFSGLTDTTSATTEKTTINFLDSSPWFTKGTNSGYGPWYPHPYEDPDYISTYVGGMSWLGGSPSEPDCWARFKPYLSQPGEYEVSASFYACENTSNIVPFTVRYDGGRKTIKVDQSSSIRTWKEKKLGTWYFKAGADTYVEVTDATGEPYDEIIGLTIGAIEFVKKETVPAPVITGIDPSQPTASPTWQWITIKGTGFVSDSTVTLCIGSSTYPIPADRTEFKGSTQIRVYVRLTDPGTWTAQVTNPGNRISNLFSFTVKQDIPSPVHDVTVTDVYTFPDSPNVYQLTTIYVTVKNEGSQQENDVPVKAYVDGYQVGSTQHVTLTDGRSTTKSFSWTPSTEKTYSVKGEVGIVSGETDTSDNKKTISVSVQQQNIYWLAKAIMSEASVGTHEERIAVGWTVLNRLDSNDFPSTIKQVVESGYAHNQEPTQKIIDLSKDILERKYADPTGGATYFFSPRSMKSGYGPYEISGTNKNSLIPSWAIPKGYSKTSSPPSDWEMTEFYKTIENLEWVSGLEDIRNWYFMFYRPINQPPVAIFTYSLENPLSGQTIIFKASDSYDPDLDGEIFSYKWNFGDGTIIEGLAESGLEEHRFRGAMGEPKEYTVKLTVKDNKGATASYTDSITVYPLKRYIIFYSSLSQFLPPPAPKIMEVTVYYNWVEETDGQDEYIVSEVHLDSELSLSFALYMFYINDDSQKIWSKLHKGVGKEDVSFTYPFNVPRDHAKTIGTEYFEGLAVGSNSNLNFVVDGLELGLNLRPTFFRVSRTIELGPGKQTEVPSIYPEGEMAGILAALSSPAELHIYDSQGNVTGLVNGKIKEEILNSIYDEESKTGVIFSPEDINSYSYEIVGTDEGLYGLGVTSVEDGEVNTFTATDIPTSTNAIHQYTIDWAALSQGEKGVTVKIDSNGNGTFERTIITNNSFYPLIAEFTFSPENPLIGEKVTLDASTSFDLGGRVIKKYRWEFYNAANQDPFYVIEGRDKEIIRYTFTSEGIYLVRLTVTDDEGEYSYTESSITIKEPVFYVPDDYPSIQAAVDAANAGDTIIVRDGTYSGNVDIDKSITLKSSSENPGNTIVQAANPNDHVFEITADYVNISGFTVGGVAECCKAVIFLNEVNYCNISNNHILNYTGISGEGILLDSSNSNTVFNNTFSGYSLYSLGIGLMNSTNNLISDNTICNCPHGGIELGFASSNNIILNNTFKSCGLCVWRYEKNTVEGNTVNDKPLIYLENVSQIVVDNAGQVILANCEHIKVIGCNLSNATIGIDLLNSSNCVIENNICRDNFCGGIDLFDYSSNNIVLNNIIDNNFWGIFLTSYASNNTIVNNICENNYFGIHLSDTNNNRIYLNNLNNDCNVQSYNSCNIWNSKEKITYSYDGESHTNYLGNYWSDYTGTDANKNGIGDSPYSIDDRGGDIDQDYYPLMTSSEHYFNPTIPTLPPTQSRPTLTPAPRPTVTLAPRPTPALAPRPTLRPTATLFEKIEGLTAAIRVGVCI